ncbi:MAG: WYL domain-containing protein [Bacteroidaceae bacterium]|nr:WYL domain-containing protein [Bacteroidaceae bacterium]
MAYSELVKNFDRIRDYMRQFYVYGFKSRTEYDKKSARSYDNERRRLESWLGDYMRFRQTADGKNVFLSVDSRSIPGNPLYNAFKAKSFTAGDVTFHFYILDLLRNDEAHTVQEILDLFFDKYLSHFESDWQPDISTIRKKLKEYVSLGILTAEKRGRELYYRRAEDNVKLSAWADTAAFFSEADPLGVIGSTILDQLNISPDYYQFKHHYILHTLDSQILLQLLEAIGERRAVKLSNISQRSDRPHEVVHTVCPLQIFISTQGGRQYLLCYHYRFKKLMFFRLDYIQKAEALAEENQFEKYMGFCQKFHSHLWGTSGGAGFTVDHLEMTLHFDDNESYIPQRLEREKRNGRVEIMGPNTCKYIVDTYDASELIPWLRTFIGRIERLECSDATVVKRFYQDLDRVYAMYGGEG